MPGLAPAIISWDLDVNATYNVESHCSCDPKEGQVCSSTFPMEQLPSLQFNTTNFLFNLGGRNISQFRLNTFANTSSLRRMM